MNSKMVRVHIDKKAFISSGFSCSNNFGTIRTWTSVIWSLIGWWFGPSSFGQFFEWKRKEWICLNELGPNHQPISDQITEVQVLIDPKLLLHENSLEINAFLSIWTRTIFEFIYASTCTVVKLYYFTWYVCIWWSKSSDMILISDLFDGKRITVEWESLWEDRTCDIFRSGMLVDFLVFDLIEIIHIHISYGIIIYCVDTNDRNY